MVFGGSWGSTLGLFYSQAHPDKVSSIVLRGLFLARKSELTSNGIPVSAQFFPQEWEAFLTFLPENERADPKKAYYARLTSGDPEVVSAAAREWTRWDLCHGKLKPNPKELERRLDDSEQCLTQALFEAHYITKNAVWMEDGELLFPANMEKIKNIPGALVQGRYDMVCPPVTALEVHRAWPKSSLYWVEDAGHASNEPGTTAKLTQVCDELAKLESRVVEDAKLEFQGLPHRPKVEYSVW
ncbi:Alpha/Beta hydrolase protein [Xylaria sp. FL1777]|nr:Alpha/Beta hydrolase protein [Xylaria sp. FL1777]